MEADRKTTLVGVGGGVITDLTGYAASVYMRGIPFWIYSYNHFGNGRCKYRGVRMELMWGFIKI
jgi:hypothetical protein